jgi:hypothetical protein
VFIGRGRPQGSLTVEEAIAPPQPPRRAFISRIRAQFLILRISPLRLHPIHPRCWSHLEVPVRHILRWHTRMLLVSGPGLTQLKADHRQDQSGDRPSIHLVNGWSLIIRPWKVSGSSIFLVLQLRQWLSPLNLISWLYPPLHRDHTNRPRRLEFHHRLQAPPLVAILQALFLVSPAAGSSPGAAHKAYLQDFLLHRQWPIPIKHTTNIWHTAQARCHTHVSLPTSRFHHLRP